MIASNPNLHSLSASTSHVTLLNNDAVVTLDMENPLLIQNGYFVDSHDHDRPINEESLSLGDAQSCSQSSARCSCSSSAGTRLDSVQVPLCNESLSPAESLSNELNFGRKEISGTSLQDSNLHPNGAWTVRRSLIAAHPSHVRVRYLSPADIHEVKALCNQIFPIEYPDYWFKDITTNTNLFSLAATDEDKIVGILVSEVKRLNQCNAEDRNVISKSFPANTPVAYVLSLGVLKQYRRHGIGTLLMDHLIVYLSNGFGTPLGVAKAIYLHVLATNTTGLAFYERLNFRRHAHLRGYYSISGQLRDGYCMVYYINGGYPPWSFSDACVGIVSLCSNIIRPFWLMPRYTYRLLCRYLTNQCCTV